MKRQLRLLVLLGLLCVPTIVRAQVMQLPNGASVTGNLSVSGTSTLTGPVTATGGLVNGCTWSVTIYGGAAPQTSNVACLANFSHVTYGGAATGASPTAVITPGQAATTPNVSANCAITASGSTTVACLAPAGQATTIIYGFAW